MAILLMNTPSGRFIVRWLVCSFGIWIAAALIGTSNIAYQSAAALVIAGFILAVINSFIKPIVVILSLPAILFSLGLFMLIINGLMVLLVSQVYSPLHVQSFGAAIVAGMVIGLVNYLVTTALDAQRG